MTDPETRAIPVDVVQADRDAAAAYWKSQGIGTAVSYRAIRHGDRDDSHLVMAFARHRITALETLAAENARLREVLEPFAKAGELFDAEPVDPRYHVVIYAPAAGDEYKITDRHLRAALSPVTQVKESGL